MTDILSKLIDHTITNTLEINDFTVGSAIRALYEAVSIEMEQFYMLTRENIAEGIEQGVYSAFDFNRKPPIRAFGIIEITFHNIRTTDVVIPRGSQFSSGISAYPQSYETLEDVFVPRGSITVEVEVYCTVRGTVGNVPAGVIGVMRSSISNVKDVNNPSPFQTGTDEEPIEELHARFNAFIASRGRATIPALEYGTREVEEVSGVYIEEKTGQVKIYAHDRNGNLSNLVKNKIIDALEEYRPAGIQIVVSAVEKVHVDLAVEVTLTRKGAETNVFKERIRVEIENYLNRMSTSKNLVLSDLSSIIKSIDKQLIYDIKFIVPESNIIIKGSDVIRAGVVTVTFGE